MESARIHKARAGICATMADTGFFQGFSGLHAFAQLWCVAVAADLG